VQGGEPGSRSLRLELITPFVRQGEVIEVKITAKNAAAVVVEVFPPDTIVVSSPHKVAVGKGTFSKTVKWTVEHGQPKTAGLMVEISVFADGQEIQKAMCRVNR
jgi:hypothetical protein